MLFNDYFNLLWNKKEDGFFLRAKELRTRELVSYMLDRTQEIFVWKGLPKTIPCYELELMLQTFGNVCIADVQDTPKEKGLYALYGGLGGILNAYYNPTIYVIANPYLEYNKELEIDKDCVRMRNDRMGIGLLPMFIKYATMQNENEISLNMLSILYRIGEMVSADDDRTYESAKAFFDDIVGGKFGVISSSEFFDGIQVDKQQSLQNIKDLIEYEQYIKASWYNEIGLNSNYNMKRERIVASEAQMNDDALIPLVENMLSWRKKGIEKIKEMFGDKYDLSELDCSLNYIWDLDNTYVSIDKDTPEESDKTPEEVEEELEETEEESTEETEEETEETEESTEESTEEETEEETKEETEEETENETVDVNININVEGGDDDEK